MEKDHIISVEENGRRLEVQSDGTVQAMQNGNVLFSRPVERTVETLIDSETDSQTGGKFNESRRYE